MMYILVSIGSCFLGIMIGGILVIRASEQVPNPYHVPQQMWRKEHDPSNSES